MYYTGYTCKERHINHGNMNYTIHSPEMFGFKRKCQSLNFQGISYKFWQQYNVPCASTRTIKLCMCSISWQYEDNLSADKQGRRNRRRWGGGYSPQFFWRGGKPPPPPTHTHNIVRSNAKKMIRFAHVKNVLRSVKLKVTIWKSLIKLVALKHNKC